MVFITYFWFKSVSEKKTFFLQKIEENFPLYVAICGTHLKGKKSMSDNNDLEFLKNETNKIRTMIEVKLKTECFKNTIENIVVIFGAI